MPREEDVEALRWQDAVNAKRDVETLRRTLSLVEDGHKRALALEALARLSGERDVLQKAMDEILPITDAAVEKERAVAERLREALRPLWACAEGIQVLPSPVEWERLREPLWDAIQDAATAYAKTFSAGAEQDGKS